MDAIAKFTALHDQSKKTPLPPEERAAYEEAKELIARAICTAQCTAIPVGQLARSAFRVGVILKVEISLSGAIFRSVTMDVSLAGFAALLSLPVTPGLEGPFKIALKDGPIVGRAIVAACERMNGSSSHRVTFGFTELQTRDMGRLETALFDAVLAQRTRR
jgi:hypothetical protein